MSRILRARAKSQTQPLLHSLFSRATIIPSLVLFIQNLLHAATYIQHPSCSCFPLLASNFSSATYNKNAEYSKTAVLVSGYFILQMFQKRVKIQGFYCTALRFFIQPIHHIKEKHFKIFCLNFWLPGRAITFNIGPNSIYIVYAVNLTKSMPFLCTEQVKS